MALVTKRFVEVALLNMDKPKFELEEKRLVDDAVVEKMLVVVPLVRVTFPRADKPDTASEVSVLRDVSDDEVTPDARVLPVSVPAGAMTALVPAAVIRPLPLTVKFGMAVEEPKLPVFELTVARVVPFPTD